MGLAAMNAYMESEPGDEGEHRILNELIKFVEENKPDHL